MALRVKYHMFAKMTVTAKGLVRSAKSPVSTYKGDSFAQMDARQGYRLHPLPCGSFILMLINPSCDAQLQLIASLHDV